MAPKSPKKVVDKKRDVPHAKMAEEDSLEDHLPSEESSTEEAKREDPITKYYALVLVVFSLIFSVLATILLFNYVGFDLKERFSTVVVWSATVVAWGWIMVLSMFAVDRLTRGGNKKIHSAWQILSSLAMGAGLVYLLIEIL